MREYYLKNKKNIDKILHFLILVAFLYVFVKYLSSYFAPLILGYIICLIVSPLDRILTTKLRLPKALSSVLSIATLIILLLSIGTSIISKVIYEARAFIKNSPEFVSSLGDTLRGLQDNFQNLLTTYMDFLPDSIKDSGDKMLDTVIQMLTSLIGSGVKTGSVEVVKILPNVLFVTLLGIICAFFILNDRKNVESFIYRQFPAPLSNRIKIAKAGLVSAIGGYIKAECILMCVVGTICIVGLCILGSPYALLLGIVISFVDALPVFGSGAIFWPWCVYSIIVGNYKMAIGIAIINITIIITRQMLEPRILGNQIGLHPVATLMAIFIGLKIFGVFGFILGPIVLVTIKAMQDSDLLPKWK